MPKNKTHSGIAKRFKVTGKGKVSRFCAYKSHNLSCKTHKQKKQLTRKRLVSASQEKSILRLLQQ